ncbi:NtaA/DmoA family FMN-dependent monooxygenase [Streptomyces samsunensis]|uniref:NtaA/DmoA family FMN-dependent monooxygenase n=1 Tax=Streptomyces malaysiensis TaxID=92644 RepID=UPI001581E30E|nr:NtaA/DmoA family FMN-dependent monooxygenase [Streptomyces samsunensis]NUH38765.1 NtaA/DmoA family FMN-dependent monooxygenase [Streptomyces samsunensis]
MTSKEHTIPGRDRPLIFNAFEMTGVGYYAHGTWTHPRSRREGFTDLAFWLERARQFEEGLFDAVFFADVLGVYDVYRQSADPAIRNAVDFPLLDPVTVIPAMAAVTRHLGFAVTVSTTYEHPYPHARRFASLDHLTGGRIGWNVVTSYLPNAARNFGLSEMPGHTARYARAEEFLEVSYKLWEGSWLDDAVLYDKENTVYADPAKVRRIDHHGQLFDVQGPSLVPPSPQRTPVIYQAGASERGRAFAGRHAEAVFVNGTNPDALAAAITAIRDAAAAAGRRRDDLRVVTDLSVVIGRTEEEARHKADLVRRSQSVEGALAGFGGASGIDLSTASGQERLSPAPGEHSQSEAARFTREKQAPDRVEDVVRRLTDLSPYSETLVGTPAQIADGISRIAETTGVDGFNLHEFVTPDDFTEFIESVVPILQRRGLYRTAYEPGSHRHRLLGAGDRVAATHPAAAFREVPA